MIGARPPLAIAPHDFFTTWLPEEFAREFGPGKRTASDVFTEVNLLGEGGGRWCIGIQSGNFTVTSQPPLGQSAAVSLWQTVEDWRALAAGEPGAIELVPPHASALDVLFVDPASRLLMKKVHGTLRFEISDFHHRTWWMNVKFGTQPLVSPPEATLRIDAFTYKRIVDRSISPAEAYFSGEISLLGNTALAMQLGMNILPRFVGY